MISRYVLWNKTTASEALRGNLPAALCDALALQDNEAPDAESFPQTTRLIIRNQLAQTGVGAEVVLNMVDGRASLHLASAVTIEEMELSVRSYNCFKDASIETLEQLLTWKPSRLMALPNFGRKCMNEVTDIVHRLGHPWFGIREDPGREKAHRFPEGSAPLACLISVGELVSGKDLAERLIERGWHSVADLAVHNVRTLIGLTGASTKEWLELELALQVLSLDFPVELPNWFLYNAGVLRDAFRVEIGYLKHLLVHGEANHGSIHVSSAPTSLNHELIRLIPASYDERKRKIVLDLLGCNGKDPLTLDGVAKTQTPPMTRERVRQIVRPLTDVLGVRGRELPSLSKAIAALKRLAPCSLEQAEDSLLKDKILSAPMTVMAILGLAKRCGLEHGLLVNGDSLLNLVTAELLRSVKIAGTKLSSHWGVGDWQEIETTIPDVVASVKENLSDVAWLDAEQRYFVFPGRENNLANRLAKILAVAPRLKVAEAYRGVFRDVRMEVKRLPEALFIAFCKLWPWCFVDGDEVVARVGLPPSEASGDDLLVLLLREIGHPVRRRELTQKAVEQGISIETITMALSYSNVIASTNGYFAVIGDPRLEELSLCAINVAAEILDSSEIPENGGLVPEVSMRDFAGLLMLAVEERVLSLGLAAPWSVSELCFSQWDRDQLLKWGQLADWDFRDDSGNYQAKSGEKVRKRTALGLAFLLFASEAVRRFGDSGSVWPAIEGALGERQKKLFMVRTDIPKLAVREGVEAACRTFGLRHGFEDVGQQVWVRTIALQSGLLCSHLPRLGEMLDEPAHLQPLVIHILLDAAGPNASASFRASWKMLQDVRLGLVSEEEALEGFGSDAWLMPFLADELLAQCRTKRQTGLHTVVEFTAAEMDEAYQYFSEPILRWTRDEAYLEFSLNTTAPPWRESATLVFLCEDPFRRECISIENDRWQLPNGSVCVPLTQRPEAGFRFKLIQGKDAVFADWTYAGLLGEMPFVFFRTTGTMIPSADDVPQSEDVVLMHSAETQMVGLPGPLTFRTVLRGARRLTRLPAGAVTQLRLVNADGETLWSLPVPEDAAEGEVELQLQVRGGKWGAAAEVTLPELPFLADRLRLNSGEVLPVSRAGSRAWLPFSPGLGRAQTGYLQGVQDKYARRSRVKLRKVGTDFGAAIEMDGSWRPLDGSTTLDAATLRTHRLLAKGARPLDTGEDVCWMEGDRALVGLRDVGSLLSGMQGLGESLNVVRGTYNISQVEVPVARAVMDGGFWHSVQRETDGRWSAQLPFEGELEEGHRLWAWTGDSMLPREVPREYTEKSGFTLRWSYISDLPVYGWAFSFAGARIGSIVWPEMLGGFMRHLSGAHWREVAMWLRWWHVPVLHEEVKDAMAGRVSEAPVESLKAWLLPASEDSGMVFDELREEAWATAAREFLWDWRPDRRQAVEIVKAVGIWTGEIEHDSRQPSLETIRYLERMSPILLVDVLRQALPELYPYAKPELAALLGMTLEAVNPNAVSSEFRMEKLCERYAKSESRLDGRFILTCLIGAARALLHGETVDKHNLRIALHQSGLRELISIALLRDLFESWRMETED